MSSVLAEGLQEIVDIGVSSVLAEALRMSLAVDDGVISLQPLVEFEGARAYASAGCDQADRRGATFLGFRQEAL